MNDIFYRRINIQGLVLSTLLLASMFTVIAPTVANATNLNMESIQKLTTGLAESLASATTAQLNVIVQTLDNSQVVQTIEELGGQVTQVYKSVEAVAASIPTSKLLDLASSKSVVRVFEDKLRVTDTQTSGAIGENARFASLVDKFTNEPMLSTELANSDVESLAIADILSVAPSIYTNAYLTHAEDVWSDTGFGNNSLVVIIDTGVWSASPFLVGNVIGGVDISYDVGTPYEGYNATTNYDHGTFCAQLLAAHGIVRFGVTSSFGNAIYRYDPTGTVKNSSGIYVTCMGIAPAASIYGIKVFDHTGAGTPSSIIMQGIDIAIQMKLSHTRDVNVISMSLGGGVGADGEDPEDLLVDAATNAGITVVTAAGNEGPAPLKVGSPGSAKTAIAVGAAMDPIHERVAADILYAYPGIGPYFYPHDDKSIVDFSSRGPAADGRVKPEVVATGDWCFLGPYADGYVYIGGGTSFSCPQVAGEAALLNSYIEQHHLNMGPAKIKLAIYDGAVPISGFSAMEQGAGYINALNSLNAIKSASFTSIPTTWPHYIDSLWFAPISTISLDHGKATVNNIVLEPGKYKYYSFWVDSTVSSVKVTLNNVQLADPSQQNPVWGDDGILYASTPERGGVTAAGGDPAYYFYELYFTGDGQALYTSNAPFQPGLVRLVLAGDFSAYSNVTVGQLVIEVTNVCVTGQGNHVTIFNAGTPTEAQVDVYNGKITTKSGAIRTGQEKAYTFNVPDANGFAYVFLSWYRDWAHWATSDLDLVILNPDGTVNVDGATGASPEAAMLNAGSGTYKLLVDGYQVYFGKTECYTLEIVYFANPTPLWSSPTFSLKCMTDVKSPVAGLATVWLHDKDFDTWFIGGFAQVTVKSKDPNNGCF